MSLAIGILLALQAATLAPESDRRVDVSQVGEGNSATIRQASGRAAARVEQDGSDNSASIVQSTMDAPASPGPPGPGDLTRTEGIDAPSVSILQRGGRNSAEVQQFNADGSVNIASMAQHGHDNMMRLDQSGSDNRAELSQIGDGNTMTASQSGNGNALGWNQTGNGLPDMRVIQTGGQAMSITQVAPH